MRNLNKEREVLAQLYSNDADVAKYLPFFFKDIKQLELFFDFFGGKIIKLPESFREYMEQYLNLSPGIQDKRKKGINLSQKTRQKIIESYLNLFSSLEEVIETEVKRS